MANEASTQGGAKPGPLTISRLFKARRELVFEAWSRSDHIKRWFSPQTYTTPEAEVDFRPGGVFALCMRSPGGQENWMRGIFTEVSPPDSLAFDCTVEFGGVERFRVLTAVTFAEESHGCRMTVTQSYEIFDPAFLGAIAGAPEGWRTTLDKLEREIERMDASPGRSVVHGDFTLTRVFAAKPEQVYRALSDPEAKARWFGGGQGYRTLESVMDVRAGGRERVKGLWDSGLVTTFDAVYFDVIPNERLVYAYEMHLDDRKISVSLASLSIAPEGEGARLTLTEQGAFLDGFDDAGTREQGTRGLLDRLAESLSAA